MRALSEQQQATVAAEPGYSSYVRARVLRNGDWWDLSALSSVQLDFLQEVEVTESIDSPIATATVRCLREVNGFSLAPLVRTSLINIDLLFNTYDPLLAEGRTFVVEAAMRPLGMRAGDGDWIEVFRGRIDSVDVGADGLVFEGRDYLGGLLQDSSIEVERDYGTGDPVSGDPVQNVMDVIIRDNTALGLGVLYTPADPSWNLGHFLQRCEPVMDALTALAQQLGWEVRYKWDNASSQYRVTFWSPDRTAAAPVRVFTATEYQALSQVRTSLEDVRNVVEVVYSDRADLDVAGEPKRKTVMVSDSDSITAYGRRFMRVAEAATSNIDTSSEASTLANAALADLKSTALGLEMEVDFHPDLELGDLVGVEGTGVHFSEAQMGAVRELTHTFNASGATTKLTLLGKPSTSVRRWLSMEQRPTTAPASPFTGPAAPTGLSSATTAGGFRLSFSPPVTGAKAASYELHVSTSSGFTPSDSTRRGVGDRTEVVVTDLDPGTTYYAKVVARDAKGNRGPSSSEVTLTARYVEPRALQPRVTYAALPLNSDFEAYNDSAKPPDGWEMGTGTWGADANVDTTKKASGGQALRMEATAIATELRSATFVCSQGDLVRCSAAIAVEGLLDANHAELKLRWLDSSFSELSLTTLGTAASTGLSNFNTTGYGTTVVAPVGTCYAQLVIKKASAGTFKVWVDSCRALVEPGIAATSAGFAFQNGFSDATPSGSAGYILDSEGFVFFEGAVTASPIPSAGTVIALLPSGVRPLQDHLFPVVSEGGTFGSVKIQRNGSVTFISGTTTTRLWLDGIRYRSLVS